MSDELMAYMKGIREERKQHSSLNFARTAITKLEAALAVELPEKGVYSWEDWRQARSDFPLFMCSAQEVLDIGKFCKKPASSPVWKKFMDYMDDHPNRGALGLVVKALGNGLYVIHNKWDLPQTAGGLCIRYAAATEGLGICLSPVPAFAAAVKLVWHP